MQTFLTNSNYEKSAQALDNRRLRKQTWECKQILEAVIANRIGEKRGWQSHCITRMWQNHPHSLLCYWAAMVRECAVRGLNGFAVINDDDYPILLEKEKPAPDFVYDKRIKSAYRAHLLAKDFSHYSQFGWTEQPKSGYYAPNIHGEWVLYSGGDDTGKKLNQIACK